jgi:DNA replication protein DnaC
MTPSRNNSGRAMKMAPLNQPMIILNSVSGRPFCFVEVLLKLDSYRMIVIDDLGYVKRDNVETGGLFELIAHRYQRGSLIITINHPFSEWGSIFLDETMAVAVSDRLIHHGYIFEVTGESYRKKTSKAVTRQSVK